MPTRYAQTSTEMLLNLLTIPNMLGIPAVIAELSSRGIDRRTSDRRIVSGYGRRCTDLPAAARPVSHCTACTMVH